jgi:hypothetical protein
MTDRFYPKGLTTEKNSYKTTYEVQNEMRSFARSPYPPGTSVHMPGARDKFGFSSPGPIAHRLAKPLLCPTEDTDIAQPRAHLAEPRYQAPNDVEVFEELDVPEMQMSYKSPVATMSFSKSMNQSGMTRSFSLPSIERKTVTKLHEPNAPISKLECDQFSYFVPRAMARDGHDKLYAANLSKLQKHNRLTMPFGDGTGFRTQNTDCKSTFWPCGEYASNMPTSYRTSYLRPAPRMSPFTHPPPGVHWSN